MKKIQVTEKATYMNSKREFTERMKMFTKNNTEQKLRSLGKRQNEEVK